MSEIVEIERMSYGPEGIAHLASGKTVFVSGAVTGDIAEISIKQEKANFAKADAVKIVSPSPLRSTDVPCAVCAECGGCPWAALSYPAQLEAKRSHIVEALVRTAGMGRDQVEATVSPCIPSKRVWGYRNKIELAAFSDAGGRFSLGMHASGSDKVFAVERCPLANRLIERAPKAIAGALRFLSGREELGIFRVELRASLRTKSVEIALWTPPGSFPRARVANTLQSALKSTSIVRVLADPGKARKVRKVEVLEGDGFWREILNMRLGGERMSGDERLGAGKSGDERLGSEEFGSGEQSGSGTFDGDEKPGSKELDGSEQLSTGKLGGDCMNNKRNDAAEQGTIPVSYTVSAPSFFQVNTAQAEKMVQLACDSLAPLDGKDIADLYSGVGTFSIPMALGGAYVTAIELAGSSARDARRNIEQGDADVDAICDDVSRVFTEIGPIDALLVDPPRAGLAADVIEHIAACRPSAIIYASCDPQTLARDTRRLQQKGFALKSVTPLDLFPQTYHVEAMAMFC